MPKKEFKIGEVFQCGLVKLKCVEAKREKYCTGCFFEANEDCASRIVGNCSFSCREDNTDVIFVKVEG